MPRILIVDDERQLLALLSLAFRKAGYEVSTATCGEQALGLCEAHHYDVVLSDLYMPGMDGHQTVSRIHASTPGIVSLMMSGFDIERTGAGCSVLARHSTLLQKPFAPHLAVSTVDEVLSQRAFLSS